MLSRRAKPQREVHMAERKKQVEKSLAAKKKPVKKLFVKKIEIKKSAGKRTVEIHVPRSGHMPMPNLASQDPYFMESLAARPLRILAEYIDPLGRIRQANVADTIVIFGSARIQPRDRAVAQLQKLRRAAGR